MCSQWRTQEFFSRGGVSTNSVEDRGQREMGSGDGSKTSEFREGFEPPTPPPPWYANVCNVSFSVYVQKDVIVLLISGIVMYNQSD
jgi:hypothetical protein